MAWRADLDQQLRGDGIGAAHLAGQHHAVGRDQGLAGDARLRIGGEEGVDHGIGNAVADLVRMAFRHRFAGEDIIALGHGPVLLASGAPLREVPCRH